MRTSTIIAVASAMVSSVLAAPAPVAAPAAAPGNWKPKGSWGWGHAGAWHGIKGKGKGKGDDQCLTDEDATEVASVFQQLIQGYTLELTEEALTVDFVDWSSAVNIIRNRGGEGPNVVNAVTFTSREQFSANHGKQPNIPFETLNVFHGCNHTSVRWQTLRSGNGQVNEQAAIPVVGTAILETIPDSENSYGWRIKTLFSEFNTAAWLVNNGVFTPNSTLTPPPAKRDLGMGWRVRM
jgi:hypothetical protein